jgi:glutamate-1-semialdehyde 2,1-aminomutase
MLSPTPSILPDATDIAARAAAVLPGGVSHAMRHSAWGNLHLARGEGAHVWDLEGNRYVDYLMGSASVMPGHAYPPVVAAIAEAARHATFLAKTHPLEVAWAEKVVAMVPGVDRVRFTSSGTEAMMLAVRLARAFAQKPMILRFEGHYHGWADTTLPGSESPYDRAPGAGLAEASLAGILTLPPDLDAVEQMLAARHDIAAVMVEPSGANWGSVPLPDGFLKRLEELVRAAGVLLIFDEIISGFRWDAGGIQAIEGLRPDLTTLAKILTGGMPGGAVGGRADIMALLDPSGDDPRRVVHKGTFNGAPIVAAAALATLTDLADGAMISRAAATAGAIRAGFQTILDEHQVPGAVYGGASTFHIYFGRTPEPGSVFGLSAQQIRGVPKERVAAYQRGMRDHGVNTMSHFGGVVSAAHGPEEVELTLRAFEATLAQMKDQNLLPK